VSRHPLAVVQKLVRPLSLPACTPLTRPRIMSAAAQCADGVRLNHAAVRTHTLDVPALDRILAHPHTTPANRAALRSLAESNIPPTCAPCAAMHPAISSCAALPLLRFADVFRRMLPLQVALHLVPALVLRPRAVWRRPARVLLGAMRSAAFLGVLAVLYQCACLPLLPVPRANPPRSDALPQNKPPPSPLPLALLPLPLPCFPRRPQALAPHTRARPASSSSPRIPRLLLPPRPRGRPRAARRGTPAARGGRAVCFAEGGRECVGCVITRWERARLFVEFVLETLVGGVKG
jgi:hypothetical protein